MADVIKVLGTSQACNSTPNNFASGVLIRTAHAGLTSDTALITCKFANTTVKFTIVSIGGSNLFIQKSPTDTLESNNATTVTAVPVAFAN